MAKRRALGLPLFASGDADLPTSRGFDYLLIIRLRAQEELAAREEAMDLLCGPTSGERGARGRDLPPGVSIETEPWG